MLRDTELKVVPQGKVSRMLGEMVPFSYLTIRNFIFHIIERIFGILPDNLTDYFLE